jgi:uncharacterized protein (DUF2141 family)
MFLKKLIFLGYVITCSMASLAADLQVTIQNIQQNQGFIRVAIFNKPTEFPNGDWQHAVKIPAQHGSVVANFKNFPEGEYAMACYHDLNENNKLDFNLVGVPTEPVGFSNNVKATFSAPSFASAAFHFKENLSLTIQLSN